MSNSKPQTRNSNEQSESERESFELKLRPIISKLWLLTSDYTPSDDDVSARAWAWSETLNPAILDKYLAYTIKACLISRERKGPIHADEFMQVWVLVKSGQVWSTRKREWTTLIDQICTIYEQSPVYDLNRRDFPEPTEAIQEKIKAQIYGWEEA